MYLLTLLTNARIKANNVYPDQTAPSRAVWSGSTLFVEETSKSFQQTTNAQTILIVIDALRVKPLKESGLSLFLNQLPMLFLNAATRGSLSSSF